MVNQKGIILSLDAIISLTFIFTIVIALFILVHNYKSQTLDNLSELSLYKKGILIADSIVKLPYDDSRLNGAAIRVDSKRRSFPNVLSFAGLKSLNFSNNSSLKKIELEFKNKQTETIYSSALTSNCIVVERFVLYETILKLRQKVKLKVVVCNE